jgi:hypothetical protein
MSVQQTFKFDAVCQMVRKYRWQMVGSIESDGTAVPLAKRDEFLRLSEHRFLTVAE